MEVGESVSIYSIVNIVAASEGVGRDCKSPNGMVGGRRRLEGRIDGRLRGALSDQQRAGGDA